MAIKLKNLLNEKQYKLTGTPLTRFCADFVLKQPQFSYEKWDAIWVWANRKIGSTNTDSQHNSGNAIDFSKSPAGSPILQELCDFLFKHRKLLNIQNLIYNKRIWNERGGWHAYRVKGGDDHETHVHVDFIINASTPDRTVDSYIAADINKKIMKIVYDLYNVITKYPEKYFSKYKSWNISIPTDDKEEFIFGDDEKAAAKWFYNYYVTKHKKIVDDLLNKSENVVNSENRSNLGAIQSIVNTVYNAILNDNEVDKIYKFFVFDESKDMFKLTPMKFIWSYM